MDVVEGFYEFEYLRAKNTNDIAMPDQQPTAD
jgi:hypothetical protein